MSSLNNHARRLFLNGLVASLSEKFELDKEKLAVCVSDFEHMFHGGKAGIVTPTTKSEPSLKEKLEGHIEKLKEGQFYNVSTSRVISQKGKHDNLTFIEELLIAGVDGETKFEAAKVAFDYHPAPVKRRAAPRTKNITEPEEPEPELPPKGKTTRASKPTKDEILSDDEAPPKPAPKTRGRPQTRSQTKKDDLEDELGE